MHGSTSPSRFRQVGMPSLPTLLLSSLLRHLLLPNSKTLGHPDWLIGLAADGLAQAQLPDPAPRPPFRTQCVRVDYHWEDSLITQ